MSPGASEKGARYFFASSDRTFAFFFFETKRSNALAIVRRSRMYFSSLSTISLSEARSEVGALSVLRRVAVDMATNKT